MNIYFLEPCLHLFVYLIREYNLRFLNVLFIGHFRKSLNVPTVRFKQGKKSFLSVMIIYLGSRNLM